MISSKSFLAVMLLFGLITLELSPLAYIYAQEVSPDAIQEEPGSAATVESEDTEPAASEVEAEVAEAPLDDENASQAEQELTEGETGEDSATTTTEHADEQDMTLTGEDEEEASSTEALEEIALLGSTSTATSTSASVTAPEGAIATTTIVSGDSIALANILNMVNSSFVNSQGVVLFSNFFETVLNAIDLRQYFGAFQNTGCSLVSCLGDEVVVNIDKDASIDNEVLITANSGQNTIEDSDHAQIQTGNAYAGLNLINVANTNLVDSNYLLVTLNAFQDVDGDIVFPSLSQFFSSLAHGASTPQAIDIHNTAEVNNNVNVTANAGDNLTESENGSVIATGGSHSSTNVFNQLNSSLIGGQSVSVVFRVHGSWAGEVFGAPDNLAWTAGDDGSIYLFDTGGKAEGGNNLTLHGTSTARINNNVNVIALTGENAITGSETAVISTGNAYAGANIINIANANVVGRNWILAVINIFGDFNGNIAFGRPDLWVGGQLDVPRSIENGSELQYKFTLINNGDSPATSVKLQTELNGDYLDVEDASHPYTQTDEGLLFELGTMPPGGAVEVSYTAAVQNTAPGTEIVSTAEVRQRETDNNASDNKEILSISTDERKGNGIRLELNNRAKKEIVEVPAQTELAQFEIERLTENITIASGNSTAEEKLILRNLSGVTASNVVLHDLLTNTEGTVIRDEVWELGDVLPNEEIELGYTITFNRNAPFGTYFLATEITGSNVALKVPKNGTIVYEDVAIPQTPILAANAATSSVFTTAATADIGADVYHGEETPLVPPLSFSIANAQENTQLAAAFGSGSTFDPVITFFVVVSGVLAFFAVRLFRI
jgi:hypothetical protein